jgi:drug/metabolite transporter (DMT)-like permease
MSLKSWGLLILLCFLWGGTVFFIEVALTDVTPFTLVFLRVSIAAAALLSYILVRKEKLPRDIRLWGAFLVMGFLNNIIPFSLITWGQVYITGSVASILNATTPLFTVLLAHILTQDEKLVSHKFFGIVLGFIGVFILMQPTLIDGFSVENIGQLAILGAALSYGFAGIWGKRLTKTPAVVNAFGMLACSSILMLPIVFFTEEPLSLVPSLYSLGAILALALMGTALAYILYFRLLAVAGAVNLLLVTFLIPVTALLLGVGILNERIHPMAIVGMGVIFIGLALIDGRILKWRRQQKNA